MYLKYFLILAIGFMASAVFGQLSIKGRIMQNESTTVEFCNILVLNPIDSTLIKGEINENGQFDIRLNEEEVLLKFDAIGYDDLFVKVNTSIDLGDVYLTKNLLNSVEITAKTLPFSTQNGNLKINVENSIFSNTASTQELLGKSPGIVQSNGIVSVMGSGEALIVLEGKVISLATFQSIPVSQIKAIEIIKNPDASYDAEGKAIVLVILKELGLEGLQGTVTSHYTRGFYHLGFADLNLQYKKKNLSLSAGTNINMGATGTRRTDNYEVTEGETPYTADGLYREKVYLPLVTNYLLGLRYQLSQKQVISAQFNGNYSDYDLEIENNINQKIGSDLFTIKTLDTAQSIYKTNNLSANYTLLTDSLGSNIFAGFTYSGVIVSYADTIQEFQNSPLNSINLRSVSTGINKNGIGTGQVDFVKKFAKGSIFKLGTKHSQTISNSAIYLATQQEDSVVNFRDEQFEYKEQITAAYINWNGQWKKGDYQVGLRTEYTKSTATQRGDITPYLDTNYLSFFPNFGFTTQFSKWSMSDQFTAKISRPKYNDITPYIYYINAFTSIYGNPHVQPSFDYNFEHKFSYKKMSVSLGYNYTNQARTFINLQASSEESINVLKTVNVNRRDEGYITLRKSTEKGPWYNFTLANLSYTKYTSQLYDFSGNAITPKIFIYTYNQLAVKKWFDIEIIGEFNSAYSDGRRKLRASGELDVALSKRFAKNTCYMQIMLNDIFQTARPNAENIVNGNVYNSLTTQDTRFLRVLFTYTFGKLKESNYDHLQLNETETNRAQ